jgi:hypothetical protein
MVFVPFNGLLIGSFFMKGHCPALLQQPKHSSPSSATGQSAIALGQAPAALAAHWALAVWARLALIKPGMPALAFTTGLARDSGQQPDICILLALIRPGWLTLAFTDGVTFEDAQLAAAVSGQHDALAASVPLASPPPRSQAILPTDTNAITIISFFTISLTFLVLPLTEFLENTQN